MHGTDSENKVFLPTQKYEHCSCFRLLLNMIMKVRIENCEVLPVLN
jgi:hypothetical protein